MKRTQTIREQRAKVESVAPQSTGNQVSEVCGVIELIGCIKHVDDESANCVKIRRISDGQPLTQKEIWDVLNEFANAKIHP